MKASLTKTSTGEFRGSLLTKSAGHFLFLFLGLGLLLVIHLPLSLPENLIRVDLVFFELQALIGNQLNVVVGLYFLFRPLLELFLNLLVEYFGSQLAQSPCFFLEVVDHLRQNRLDSSIEERVILNIVRQLHEYVLHLHVDLICLGLLHQVLVHLPVKFLEELLLVVQGLELSLLLHLLIFRPQFQERMLHLRKHLVPKIGVLQRDLVLVALHLEPHLVVLVHSPLDLALPAPLDDLVDVLPSSAASFVLDQPQYPPLAHLIQLLQLDVVLSFVAPLVLEKEGLVQSQLFRGANIHLAFIGVLRDEPEHLHLINLADSMRPGNCLHVVLWVPIGVVYNDDVGASEVDSQPPCLGGQQKYLKHFLVLVKLQNLLLPIFRLGLPVNQVIRYVVEVEVPLQ